MENKKKGLNLRAIIPLATAIVSLVFIVVGLKDYGFWKAQPTPGFFPIIIAVVLLAASAVPFRSSRIRTAQTSATTAMSCW